MFTSGEAHVGLIVYIGIGRDLPDGPGKTLGRWHRPAPNKDDSIRQKGGLPDGLG